MLQIIMMGEVEFRRVISIYIFSFIPNKVHGIHLNGNQLFKLLEKWAAKFQSELAHSEPITTLYLGKYEIHICTYVAYNQNTW